MRVTDTLATSKAHENASVVATKRISDVADLAMNAGVNVS